MATFHDIPHVAIRHVRKVFAAANVKSARALSTHPNMYEETLDHVMVMDLTAAPAAFFARERTSVVIESHWLGSRHMFGRWEIADIAFFVVLRRRGHLQQRKVALLQMKRLYPNGFAGPELYPDDYRIGIARIADRTDPLFSGQRVFTFDDQSRYGALKAGDEQVRRMDDYAEARGIPLYYGFHNPVCLPLRVAYPSAGGQGEEGDNVLGCRVMPAANVHAVLETLAKGQPPSHSDLRLTVPLDTDDSLSGAGWRLEHFVADEVLRCRQGRLFDEGDDPNLRALFFGRSAPITAAITVTIDIDTSEG